jgi:hypothetical protein
MEADGGEVRRRMEDGDKSVSSRKAGEMMAKR